MTATDCPSGLMRGFSYSDSTSSSRIRRSPVATSMSASAMRSPPRSRTSQVVTIVEPSRLTSYSRRSRARPASGVRSLSSILGSAAVSSSTSVPVKIRGAPGPRSSSQNRTGTLSCRIAVTFLSLRSLRFAFSASWVSEDGKGLGGDHHRAGVGRDVDVVDASGTRGHDPRLTALRGQQPQQRLLGLLVVLGLRVGPRRGEQQRAVGQEGRGGLALGAAGQASRGPLAGRVDLPERGDVLGALGVQGLYGGHQPGAVRRQLQAGATRKVDVGVEVVERGLGVRITHDPYLPRRLRGASIDFLRLCTDDCGA